METLKLYEMAEAQGIKVETFPLPQSRSVCIGFDNNFFIALDEKLKTRAEERVCLAHELGHYETCAFYNLYSNVAMRKKQEARAQRFAINLLVPKERFEEALKKGYTDIASLSEYFDVTEEFMIKAVENYRNK